MINNNPINDVVNFPLIVILPSDSVNSMPTNCSNWSCEWCPAKCIEYSFSPHQYQLKL